MKMWFIFIMEYYPTIKKMKPCHLWQHGWILRTLGSVKQLRQRKTNTTWSHFYLESKKKGNRAQTAGCQSNECVVGEGCQEVWSFSYKVNKP